MDKVLVCGLKDPVGGVEKVVLEYVKSIAANWPVTFDFLFYSRPFSLEKQLEETGCRAIYVPSRKESLLRYQKALHALFRENQYAAVWCNFSGLTNIDVLIFAQRHHVPVRIAHSHVTRLFWGSPVMKYVVPTLHRWNKGRVDRYVTHYLACSPEAGAFMFPQAVQDRVILVNNAVDTGLFHPDSASGKQVRAKLGLGEDAVVIGHVARMCQAKNQLFLLRILAETVRQQPKARLLFVGDGELRQEILDEVQRLRLEPYVIFTGSRTDVPELLRAMDVFVLPSIAEGAPCTVVEAQASGVPCVVSSAVTRAVDITGTVRFLSLNAPVQDWAGAILAQADTEIDSPAEKVIQSGYDMLTASRKLYSLLVGEKV